MDAEHSNTWFDENFSGQPLMAILRGLGVTRTVELAEAAWDLGIELVEVPIQTPTDIEALTATAAAGVRRGRLVGAGTILTSKHVGDAVAAGAAFGVSPGFDADLVRAALDAGLPILPGAATASEIQHAVGLGLSWLKAFPAAALGTGWFSAMHGPFPGVSLVGTGGLDASNAGSFLGAGARVVAVGSALEDPAQLNLLAALIAKRPT